MATITNPGVWPVPLPGFVLAPRETRTVTNADLDGPDMARALPALLAGGDVTVTRDADAPAAPGQPEAMPARFADDVIVPTGEPEDPPARFAEEEIEEPAPEPAPADEPPPAPEAAPEPETLAEEVPAQSKKGA